MASCKGNFPDENNGNTPICCNLARGDKQAYPAYLHEDIQQHVYYETDGGIIADANYARYQQLRAMIASTQLFKRPLKEIRRLWYELRKCPYRDIYQCDTEQKRHVLFSTYLSDFSAADKQKYIEKYKRDAQWHTFMLYRKFYTIMRQQHP